MKTTTTGAATKYNYGTHMGADTRLAYYPERALRRTWRYGTADLLARRPFFACGEAATRGWAYMTWRNEYAREIWKQRAAEARTARVVLPLP